MQKQNTKRLSPPLRGTFPDAVDSLRALPNCQALSIQISEEQMEKVPCAVWFETCHRVHFWICVGLVLL